MCSKYHVYYFGCTHASIFVCVSLLQLLLIRSKFLSDVFTYAKPYNYMYTFIGCAPVRPFLCRQFSQNPWMEIKYCCFKMLCVLWAGSCCQTKIVLIYIMPIVRIYLQRTTFVMQLCVYNWHRFLAHIFFWRVLFQI